MNFFSWVRGSKFTVLVGRTIDFCLYTIETYDISIFDSFSAVFNAPVYRLYAKQFQMYRRLARKQNVRSSVSLNE